MALFSKDNKNTQQLQAAGRCTEVVHKGHPNERLCGSKSVSVDRHGFCKDHRKKYGLNKGIYSAKRIALRQRQARRTRLHQEQYLHIRGQDLSVTRITLAVCKLEVTAQPIVSVTQGREAEDGASPTWPSASTSQLTNGLEPQFPCIFRFGGAQ